MTPTLLAVSKPSDPVPLSSPTVDKQKGCGWGMGVGLIFVCLAVIFAVIFFLFWAFKPSFVINPTTDDIDWGKLTLSSFIAALLGTIFVWAIVSCR
jgi:hypothetical protein